MVDSAFRFFKSTLKIDLKNVNDNEWMNSDGSLIVMEGFWWLYSDGRFDDCMAIWYDEIGQLSGR